MSDVLEPPQSIQGFLFSAPLYAKCHIDKSDEKLDYPAFNMFVETLVVDGHCVECRRLSTFHRTEGEVQRHRLDGFLFGQLWWPFVLTCTRDSTHKIIFILRIEDSNIQKIGQFPSLADIANDESRTYRAVLTQSDAAELHKAIGLAAHGVGVGAFVYLRRVFERLVSSRFDTFKAEEGWKQDDFVGKRMDEKIEFLERHLPDFLVRNKKIYGILSKGIHELEDKECLNAFEMLKQAIFFILDEDKHKKEELKRRLLAEKAIANFKG